MVSSNTNAGLPALHSCKFSDQADTTWIALYKKNIITTLIALFENPIPHSA